MSMIEEIVAEGANLPPTQQILPKLQALLRRDDTDLREIQDLLRVDTGMSAQLIRSANSSFFGFADKVDSLPAAITRLGYRETYRIASYAASKDVFGTSLPLYGFKQAEFFERSVLMAIFLFELAAADKRDDREAHYTIGLLHAIGKVLINRYFLKKGLDLYGVTTDGIEGEGTDEKIHQTFGFTYAEVGARLLTNWEFPDQIVQPIRWQLSPEAALSPETVGLLPLGLAKIDGLLPHAGSFKSPLPEFDESGIEQFGLAKESYQLAIIRTLNEFAKVRKFLA